MSEDLETLIEAYENLDYEDQLKCSMNFYSSLNIIMVNNLNKNIKIDRKNIERIKILINIKN
jgi:hypothetical protein